MFYTGESIQQVRAFVALYWGEVSSRLRHIFCTGEKHPAGWGIYSVLGRSIQQVGAYILYWGKASSRLRHIILMGRSIQQVGAYVLNRESASSD
mgnify:CR=1 FL=1